MTKKTCSQIRGCKNIPIWCYRFHSNDTFFPPVMHPQLNWTIKIYVGRWKTLQQQWLRKRKPTLECWHWSAHIDHQMSKSSSSWSLLKKKNNKVRGKTSLSIQNAKRSNFEKQNLHSRFWDSNKIKEKINYSVFE